MRKRFPSVFTDGIYLILDIQGSKEEYVIAYARVFETKAVLVLTSRFFTSFMKNFQEREEQKEFWADMSIDLPPELSKFEFKDIFTERLFPKETRLDLKTMFSEMPFAVLESL